MILAAGLGTRLLPLTKDKPKPLFPLAGRPLLDILIRSLQAAGCEAVVINTHHLAHMITAFVEAQDYGIPVHTVFESTLLDTAGGIKNVEDFWDDRPFFVVNGDIFTSIRLNDIYQYHLSHNHPVTLALHDQEPFNNVWIDSTVQVRGFGHERPCPPTHQDAKNGKRRASRQNDRLRPLAFTGIQVVDPGILRCIPEETACGIVDIYCEMIGHGAIIQGLIVEHHYWHDIGTLTGYHDAAKEALARRALGDNPQYLAQPVVQWTTLKGDGSDRIWQRASCEQSSVIVVDHGPPSSGDVTCEADSFVAIGRHLHKKAVPVPEIYGYDRALGLVALEDCGDRHLQDVICQTTEPTQILHHYRMVIDVLMRMGVQGANGLALGLLYDTTHYDRNFILEKEARYFYDAFLRGLMRVKVDFSFLKEDFELLAKLSLTSEHFGFLHRDFQSRNILVSAGSYYVIDFQGARLGPLQYDLASLLIDPYVGLPQNLQETLVAYYMEKLSERVPVNPSRFLYAYGYCAVNRNLQVLGAFAFLSRVKGKKHFESYIPVALESLKENLHNLGSGSCKRLREVLKRL